MTVKVNRHGLLQSKGLRAAARGRSQPASTATALARCSDALVGSGRFWAHDRAPRPAPLPDQRAPFGLQRHEEGQARPLRPHLHHQALRHLLCDRLLDQAHQPGTLGHRASRLLSRGTRLLGLRRPDQAHPEAQIQRYQGQQLSYFNAGCPAPLGSKRTSFALALASFSFAEGKEISLTVDKSCGVKE